MTTVNTSIDLAALPGGLGSGDGPQPPGDRVTIHRKLLRADDGPTRVGYAMKQCICLRGVSVKLRWRLAE